MQRVAGGYRRLSDQTASAAMTRYRAGREAVRRAEAALARDLQAIDAPTA
jgi:hypothetical protein